jgi:cysteinyl-tRNA synthetase
MTLHLYNTLTRRKELFTPADPHRVTVYVCGPTVYNCPHIGNARAAVVFDLLYRILRERFPKVVYARNITDVDDRINTSAKAAGVPIAVITEKYTAIYHEDMAALGVLAPVVEPKVTDHLPDIVCLIERLIERGHAYVVEGHVLFDINTYPDYGRLSGRDREEMIAGARVEVAPYKRDPADFVLWKPSTPDLPGWDSPWGRGRPGWHIECSAMIERHLGETIDIHGGGQDLIFPHHENEIAQGTCAHNGKLYCRYWLHNGFVTVAEEKMSKSLGNVLLVHDLLKEVPGEAIRLVLLSSHYRQPLGWTDTALHQAKAGLDRLYGTLRRLEDVVIGTQDKAVTAEFNEALEDDMNTPKALAELFQIAKLANTATEIEELRRLKGQLLAGGDQLGLLQADPEDWFSRSAHASIDAAEIERLIAKRDAARSAKNYALADQIRSELARQGVQIEDGPEGTRWRRVE